MAVFLQARRATEWDNTPRGAQYGAYRDLLTFTNFQGETMSSVVKMPEAKKTTTVNVGTVAAGVVKTVRVSLVTAPTPGPPPGQPRARSGDLVRLGPPGTLPPGLVASGVVAVDNAVDVRVYNATGADVVVPDGVWTIQASGGPNSGAVQLISKRSTPASPLPPDAAP